MFAKIRAGPIEPLLFNNEEVLEEYKKCPYVKYTDAEMANAPLSFIRKYLPRQSASSPFFIEHANFQPFVRTPFREILQLYHPKNHIVSGGTGTKIYEELVHLFLPNSKKELKYIFQGPKDRYKAAVEVKNLWVFLKNNALDSDLYLLVDFALDHVPLRESMMFK